MRAKKRKNKKTRKREKVKLAHNKDQSKGEREKSVHG